MVKRLLALAVAITMVAVALAVRNRLDDNGSSAGAGANGGGSDEPALVACITELEEVCNAWAEAQGGIELVIENAADTEKTLVDDDNAYDAWVTLDPLPDVLPFGDVTVGESERIASSPLVIVAVRERASRLTPCPSAQITWLCLGDVQGKSWTEVGGEATWGTVKVALPPPLTAFGLLGLGQAASSYFGRTDFSRGDIESDPGFASWLSGIQEDASPDPLRDLISLGPARLFAVGTAEVDVNQRLPGTRYEDQLQLIATEPLAFATVVLAPIGKSSVTASPALRTALEEAGWGDPVPDSGLPAAGVLIALREA